MRFGLILAALLASGCGFFNVIDSTCREDPCRCLPPGVCATPTPPPPPTTEPRIRWCVDVTPAPCAECLECVRRDELPPGDQRAIGRGSMECIQVLHRRWPCPSPAPSVTPTPSPTAPPTPAPTVVEPTRQPAPEPTRTPAPPADTCAAVQSVQHTMAPGNKLHAGRARRGLVDSTIRPICDTDHLENWDSFCGRRTHDPDYARRHGAMEWTVTGAQDLGPNCPDGSDPNDECENSAQRWISGEPGAQVTVRVCIPANKRTPDGCLIVRQGDGCGERTFTLPGD